MDKIIYLHGKPEPVALYLRIGNKGHRQLETLFGAGRLYINRFLVDAPFYDNQRDLINTLHEDGAEIVLDTNIADLSVPGRFEGACRKIPWAIEDRPLEPRDFRPSSGIDIIERIARFAVSRQVDAVLSPSHLLEGTFDPWFTIDVESCNKLRMYLEAKGASNISIDYPLLIPYTVFRNQEQRARIINVLKDLPFENLWLRISHSGQMTPLGTLRYISAAHDFLQLKKPIIADCVGGLPGLAIAAFGGCGAIAHGVGEKEQFDTSSWKKTRVEQKGGQRKRIYIPGIDRYLNEEQLETLFRARKAYRIFACTDRECCKRGRDDMVEFPFAHFICQRNKQLEDLSRAPGSRRAEHFLKHHVEPALSICGQATKLKIENASLTSLLKKANKRIETFHRVIENLLKSNQDYTIRSSTPHFRGSSLSIPRREVH